MEIFAIEKGSPKGLLTKLYIGPLRTHIPGVYKSVKTSYRASVKPFLTGVSPIVPSTGPITLDFSTPVKKSTLKKEIVIDFEYDLKPGYMVSDNGRLFKDCSHWEIIPKQRLKAGNKYEIKMEGDLKLHRLFKVADIPSVTSTSPIDGETDVKLYSSVVVNFDEEMTEVNIQVDDMLGDIEVAGKIATFKPHTVFIPGKTYNVKVKGVSIFGEETETYSFNFTPIDMQDKWWVEINLRPVQKVCVYKGEKVVRSMVASGGLEDSENRTPRGFFTIKDRGEYFWTERIQEGGLYWVRITGNYLIHSIPRDKDNKIIEEELKKLGIPASHGCIRLKDNYAKWFYETVPSGTLVIIHD